MRPLILLDVDGVLNISSSTPDDAVSNGILLLAGPRGAHVTVRDDLRAMLDRLAVAGDLVWASGWNDGAPALFATLVPWAGAVPHLTFETVGTMVHKLPVVRDFVGDRSVCWIDDRIPDEAWGWAEARSAPTLLVPVDPLLGLGPEQLDVVEDWARVQRAAE